MQSEAKVGLAVILGAALLIGLIGRVERWATDVDEGTRIHSQFDTVAGLELKSPVEVAGVQVGEVERIALQNGKADVTIRLFPGVVLTKGGQAAVRSTGMLGEKYLELIPGAPEAEALEEGEYVPQVEGSGDLDRLVTQFNGIATDLRAVTKALRGAMGTPQGEEQMRDLLTNLTELSETLNQRGPQVLARLDNILARIEGGVGTLGKLVNDPVLHDELETSLGDIRMIMSQVRAGEGSLGKLVHDPSLYDNLEQATADLREITRKVSEGEGTIGRLLSDDSPVENFNSAMESMGAMTGVATRLRTFVTFHGEHQFDTGDTKGYFQVRLVPRENSAYLIGITSDPAGKVTKIITDETVGGVTTTTEELITNRRYKLSAMFERTLGPLVLRGGVMESTFGFGGSIYPVRWLGLNVDAWDFNSVLPGHDQPHLKVGARYHMGEHIFIQGGLDNFLNSGYDTSFVGAGLVFEDKDLKYMLGAAAGAL